MRVVAYTIGTALDELKQILIDYSKKSPNPNWLSVAMNEHAKLIRRFGLPLDSSDPEDFEWLLFSLPKHFTTKYRDWEIPRYCYRYSIPGLNVLARKLGRLACLPKEEKHGNRPQ